MAPWLGPQRGDRSLDLWGSNGGGEGCSDSEDVWVRPRQQGLLTDPMWGERHRVSCSSLLADWFAVFS